MKVTREEFLAGLEKDNIQEDMAEQLKRESLPLVLWGCGDVAEALYQYLKQQEIPIAAVWLDADFPQMTFHGMQTKKLEQVAAEFPRFNVILGHSHYDKGRSLPEKIPQIQKVFYAFSIHYEQYEKVPYEQIETEAERFVRLCNHVEDEASVHNLMAYLNTKMTGNADYILDSYEKPMSFYRNDVFHMSDEEGFLDIGAYNGDTIKLFLEETGGKYKKIIALEPDDKSFLELNEYLSRERIRNVVTSKIGAWNRQEDLLFKTGNEQISSVAMGDNILKASDTITIYADRLDEVYGQEDISFIKINYYEGVLEAIEGCSGILKRCHPKLAIDVGFDIYNVLKLSEFLSSLELGYKLYLRFNRAMSSTFTLYAI